MSNIKNLIKNHENDYAVVKKAWVVFVNDKKTKPADIKKLLPLLDEYMKANYTEVNTLAKKFTELRGPIKKKYGKKSQPAVDSDHLMGLGQEASAKRNKDNREKALNKSRNRNKNEAYELDEIYKAIDDNIESPLWELRLCAVGLAVGSRFIEIMSVSKYQLSKVDGNIIVVGVAKGREKDDEETVDTVDKNKTIDKPCLRVKAQKVIDAVAFIRSSIEVKGLSNEGIASKYNARVNRKIKPLFKLKTTSHKLRYIFAQVAFKLFGAGEPETFFLERVLGHVDPGTSLIYQSVKVNVKPFADLQDDVKVKLAVIENDNEALREELKELKEEVDEVKENPPQRNMKRDKSSVPELVEVIRQRVADDKPITVRALKALKYGTATVMEALKIYKANPAITSNTITSNTITSNTRTSNVVEVDEPVVETRRRSTRTYRPNNLA